VSVPLFIEFIGDVQKCTHIIFNRRSCPSSKEDISEEIPPNKGSGLVFKGLGPEGNAAYAIICKQTIKPLKIRLPAITLIDILLRRSA